MAREMGIENWERQSKDEGKKKRTRLTTTINRMEKRI